ncbi:MAG: FtsX-like permease family protein [Oscillospiraceae bacterium]|nr:FtsX-like permease family protein [Oscillospiraceae bacterium]
MVMKKSLYLNTLRSIGRTFSRFLAILLIIAISCAFYAGVKSTAGILKANAWKYLNDHALADIELRSTLGFDRTEPAALLESDTFDDAAGYCWADLVYAAENGAVLVRAYSYSPDCHLNFPCITEGRLPSASGEMLCDADCGLFAVGDTVVLEAPGDDDTGEILDVTEFTVTGLCRSPLYPRSERGSTNVGNGRLDAFVYIPEEDFAYDVYTGIYLSVKGSEKTAPFSREYDELISAAALALEGQRAQILSRRGDTIRADAEEELSDARRQLADAEEKLEKGRRDYEDGLAEYERYKENFDAGRAVVDSAGAELDNASGELGTRREGMEELAFTCERIDFFLENYKNAYLKVLPQELLDTFKEIQRIYDANNVDASIQDLLAIYCITDPEKDPATRATVYESISTVNEQVRQAVSSAMYQIDAQSDELKSKKDGIQTAGSGLIDAQTSLRQAEKELKAAEEKLVQGEEEVNKAREELTRAANEVEERIAEGKLYITARDSFDPDCMTYGEDADRVDAVAAVFPLFFVLIAALVCCATMTRMVEEQRTQAGTLKALGYSNVQVMGQYLLYAALAGITGSVIGVAAGFNFLPGIIDVCYASMYNYPPITVIYDNNIALQCIIVSLLCVILSTLYAALRELSGSPAQLVRPKAPRGGKKVLAERLLPGLWKHLPFLHKVAMRNLMRYRSRFFVMLAGIGGCTALLLTGFGLRYSMSTVLDEQFGKMTTFDMTVVMEDDASERETMETSAVIQATGIPCRYGFVNMKEHTFTSSRTGKRAKAYLTAGDSFEGFVSFIDPKTGETFTQPSEGAVITEKLSILLDVQKGDAISTEYGDIIVTGITKNHMGNYVYMNTIPFKALTHDSTLTTAFIRFDRELSEQEKDTFAKELIASDAVLSAVYTSTSLDNFSQLMDSMDIIVLVIIAFVGALSFVIMINLAEINMTERRYELASMKVLGFFDAELAAYVFRENIVSTLLGIALGLVLGVPLERFVVRTAEVDSVMFARTIPPACFAMAAVVMLIFVVLVNIRIYFRLKTINMAAAMKSTE